jgi:hypothetical protein
MDSVRGISGEMVPYRGITNKRDLLPTEYALIDHLGLTRDEYFEFLEQCHYASTERREGYELVPDIVNDPVTILVNLAIGIALSAVSALLAPKPSQQQQKERKNLQTADQNGRQQFTPYESFGTVQELARLGSIIPLIYTDYGVRVSGKMLWSHLQSQGSSQQLRAIVLFGNGITGVPDFDGIAIGDQLLKNYGEGRMRVYYSEGYKNSIQKQGYGRLRNTDEYPETDEGSWAIKLPNDPFKIENDNAKYKDGTPNWLAGLSGTRNVSTNAEFGLFYPLSNGHAYQLPYELVLVVDGSGSDAKQDARTKKSKIKRKYKINASIVAAGNYKAPNNGDTREVKVNKGDIITYRINSDTFSEDDYEPWGLTDVNSSINSRRIEFDEKLQIGEVFQIGTTRAVVVDRPRDLWREGKRHDYRLKSLESGLIHLADTDAEIVQPTSVNALLRYLDGIISNNRECDLTEIGLKSTVWKQITSFSNVNSQPSDKKIQRYEEDGDQIQLGSMSKYIERYSFFRVKARKAGSDNWNTITGSSLLCVKGNTPQAKYNALRITHPYAQHEFEFVPVAGSAVMKNLGKIAYVLQHDAELFRFSAGAYNLYFNATTIDLNIETLSNPEWIIGGAPSSKGEIVEISETKIGYIPKDIDEGSKECAYTSIFDTNEDRYYWRQLRKNNKKHVEVYWDDKKIKRKTYRDRTPNSYNKNGYTYTKGKEQVAPGGSDYTYWEICRVKAQAKPKVRIASVKREKLIGQSSAAKTASVKVTTYEEYGKTVGYSLVLDDSGSGYLNNEIATVDGIKFQGKSVTFKIQTSARAYTNLDKSLNPFDAVSDYYKYDEERSSHQDGPEHSIAYVNEIILADDAGAQYTELSIAGLVLNSGYEFQSFSQISAYFKDGIQAELLRKGQVGNIGSVNTLPEIAYDLLTNTEYGMGKSVGEDFINRNEMKAATDFCIANGFYWDGVLIEQVAIRDFLYQNAAFCMLQFCCFSGEFFFRPGIPIHSDNKIFSGKSSSRDYDETKTKSIDIAGLFTDGNMKGLEVTFLPPEQRQTFKAEVSYREEDINGFPTTKVVSVRLKSRNDQGGDKPGGSSTDPSESFDMTAFCRDETHAIRFAKYALRVRSLVTHTVSFETTPEMAQGVMPGDFIRVCTEYSHFSRFQTGSISATGDVQSAGSLPKNEQIEVYQWKVGTTGIMAGKITVNDDNKATHAKDWGSVFVRRNTSTQDRTYQVEAIEYGEEGYIKMTASFAPSKDGKLEVLDWDDDDFVISE